jgi:hypothetical protein
MTDVICPKFSPGPWAFTGECDWDRHPDNTCQYCGSINPDVFMARIEAGTVELGPTDKSYKVYVVGEGFQQSFRDCPKDAKCTGPDDCTHWVTRPHSHMKFYFEHLSFEQRSRFVDLFNEKKLKFEGGEGFYVLPFFMRRA